MSHKIISISLPKELVQEMDSLQKEMKFSGRSELIRAGIRHFLAESRKKKLQGVVECILLAVHRRSEGEVSHSAKHEFDDIISTHIHSNLKEERCLELFLLRGEARRIQEIYNLFTTSKKIEYTKLITT